MVMATNLVLKFRSRANAETSHSVADRTEWWLWGARAVVKNFQIVRS